MMFGRKCVIRINRNDEYFKIACVAADFLLLNIAVLIMNIVKYGTVGLPSRYTGFLILFYLTWLFVSLLSRKFHPDQADFKNYLMLHIRTFVLMAYFISFAVVFLRLSHLSRVYIFGACLLYFIMGTVLFLIGFLKGYEGPHRAYTEQGTFKPQNSRMSIFLLISDLFLLYLVFFGMNYFKRGTLHLTPEYEKIFLVMIGLWLVASVVTNKFRIENFKNFRFAAAAALKSIIIMTLTLSFIIFSLRLFYLSRLHIFGTLFIYGGLYVVLTFFYFIIRFGNEMNGDVESVDEIQEYIGQTELSMSREAPGLHSGVPSPIMHSFMKLLCEQYLKSIPRFHEFVDKSLDLSTIPDNEIMVVNTAEFDNLKIPEDSTIRMLFTLHKINDIRWINRLFLEIHKKVQNGGFYIGRVDTIATHKRRFFDKNPKYLAEFLYFWHFLFFRVFPKLPKLRKIYFYLTKGKNRMISRAEVLGRLCFCGFKIVAEKELGGSLFFIAKKVKTPSLDQNPSYGFLIKLRRYGLNGRLIEVFKFRTMYPYSEYLQEYIYEHQKLEEGGKIKQDFRVTDWGRFMRRYWLDELPMLYNWIKGDLKLFGVRPVSKHYLSLYDSYLRNIRRKVKPGLIPPYYADLPRQFDEINASEKRYIQAYLAHPFKTQFNYLWKVINNIVFKGARSS